MIAPGGERLVVSSDLLVEGVDFDCRYTPREHVGWKALAAGISDVTSMGARPRFALVSLGIPPGGDGRAVLRGLLRLARRRQVALVGGDLSEAPDGWIIDVTVMGTARRITRRTGARPGHRIAVSAPLGLAALGLSRLREGARLTGSRGALRRLLLAQTRPDPDPETGRKLASLASAAVDVSDGLSTDLGHLCRASGVGADIDESLLPLAPPSAGSRTARLEAALHGGEDFCLLCTYPDGKSGAAEKLGAIEIGHITRRRGLMLRRADGSRERLVSQGFQHQW